MASIQCKTCNRTLPSAQAIRTNPQGSGAGCRETYCIPCFERALKDEAGLLDEARNAPVPIDLDLFHRYLAGTAWARKRYLALHSSEFRCQACCAEDGIDVHHGSLYDVGSEQPNYLRVLCAKCRDIGVPADASPGERERLKGLMHAYGTNGCEQDFTRSITCLERALDLGSREAINDLSMVWGMDEWRGLAHLYGMFVSMEQARAALESCGLPFDACDEGLVDYPPEACEAWLTQHRAFLDAGREGMVAKVNEILGRDAGETERFFRERLATFQAGNECRD